MLKTKQKIIFIGLIMIFVGALTYSFYNNVNPAIEKKFSTIALADDDEEEEMCTRYCLTCDPCEGEPCPLGSIDSAFTKIETHHQNIEDLYDSLKFRPQNILNSLTRFTDLIEVKNLSPDDPDRWDILNKLLNSRVKMEECITGYDSVLDTPRAKMNLLSCRIALDKIYLGKLNIAGYFEDNISPFPHCYPFIADNTIKSICIKNKDSKECREAIKDYMDNYFCAGYVGLGDYIAPPPEIFGPDIASVAIATCQALDKIVCRPSLFDIKEPPYCDLGWWVAKGYKDRVYWLRYKCSDKSVTTGYDGVGECNPSDTCTHYYCCCEP